MTNLLQRFVDFTTTEVTADVNNTKTVTREINTLEEFYTPLDGKLHTVDWSTLTTLMDNYNYILCPTNKEVTSTSSKTLNKTDHDNITLWCPISNPQTTSPFTIFSDGDHSIFDWTVDLQSPTFRGIDFDGQVNVGNTTPLLKIGDGFTAQISLCRFDGDNHKAGIEITGSLINSQIYNCAFAEGVDGIIFDSANLGTTHIYNNFIGESQTGSGINVKTAPQSVYISGNIIRSMPGNGIVAAGKTYIANNMIVGTGSAAISGGSQRQDIVSVGNFIKGCAAGIFDCGVILGNYITQSDGDGLGINNTRSAVIAANIIKNSDETDDGSVGIDIKSNNVAVLHNLLNDQSGNQDTGINIASGISGVRLVENAFIGTHGTAKVSDGGDQTAQNGTGVESANAETPTSANWEVGDVVDFTDSGDGTGDGVYVLLPDGTWSQIGT